MRKREDIEQDLAEARKALSQVQGRPAEVYSRIVGYYRSVRNWNRGKREEYGERKPYRPAGNLDMAFQAPLKAPLTSPDAPGIKAVPEQRLLLFVRPTCPACPGAKAAAGQLGIPVDVVNADTEEGLAEAVRRQVFATPTAILLSPEGEELGRALDSRSIAAFGAARSAAKDAVSMGEADLRAAASL
ncbi:MAG: hypothetical protein LBG76_04595 [Treponema sp.]|jgi:ribonucleoside-triphosphate reductase|nr:hypothetical protein [Treponema sp.]